MVAGGHRGVPTQLIGRDAELEVLTAAWDAAAGGGGAVVVLVGDPASGRTSLLRQLERQVELRVVRFDVRGGDVPTPDAPSLAPRPLAAVADLAEELLCLADDGDDVGGRIADEVDPFAASKLLGELLDRVDDDGPALVLVDDLHEADPASRVALNLALRRLRPRHLLVVVSGRRTEDVRAFAEGFRVVEVSPLNRADAVALVQRSSPTAVAAPVLDKLLDHACGNPLALTQLPDQLSAAQLRGDDLLPDPLPVVGELRDAFTRPLSKLRPAARELLELCALSTDGAWRQLQTATGGDGEEALSELEAAGLARLEHGRLVPTHPLLRSSAVMNLSARRRRDLHARLAATDGVPDRARLWHRAAATVGPDEQLADDLETSAVELRSGGAIEAATALLDRAVELTADPQRRAALRLAAADAFALSGRPGPAGRRLDAVDAEHDERWRVAVDLRRSWIEALHGDPLGSWQRLQDCVPAAVGEERATVHAAMSVPLGMLGLVRRIEAEASAAVAHGAAGSASWQVARVVHRHALVSLDESSGRDGASDLVAEVDLAAAVESDPLFGLHVGRLLAVSEQYAAAETTLAELRAHTRGANTRVSLAMTMGALGETWVRSCRLDAAAAVLDEAIALSLATGQRAFTPFWLALRARLRSIRGERTSVETDLATGFDLADELVLPGARYFLLCAAGLDALTRGDPEGTIDLLEECRFFEEASDVLSPNVGRWRPDLIDAYCSVGDVGAARAVLEPMNQAAERGAGRWTTASAARCAALVDGAEDPAAAARRLREVAEQYDPEVDQFDRARALLGCVEMSRSAGIAVEEFRDVVSRARMDFRLLGAPPWEARVEEQLARSAPVADPFESLTVTELAVLEQLSLGSTNVQIARELGISPKTVANHLWKAYRKLGVSTRTEAAHRYLTR